MILHFLTIPEIQERWLRLRNLPDHPYYHPEGTTFQHILKVYNRATKTSNINLIFTSLIHDICKADSGYWKEYEGVQYWSNPDHPKQAYDLLMFCDDLKFYIWTQQGNYKLIADICLYHQQVKELTDYTRFLRRQLQGDTELLNYLLAFRELDDMINRYA